MVTKEQVKSYVVFYVEKHLDIIVDDDDVNTLIISDFVDSLDLAQFAMDIEKEFDVDIWNDDYRFNRWSVNGIVEFIYSKIRSKYDNVVGCCAVDNADKRVSEIPTLDFGIAAVADYDQGLITGFKDGAKWMLEILCAKLREINKANIDVSGIVCQIINVDKLYKELEPMLYENSRSNIGKTSANS